MTNIVHWLMFTAGAFLGIAVTMVAVNLSDIYQHRRTHRGFSEPIAILSFGILLFTVAMCLR